MSFQVLITLEPFLANLTLAAKTMTSLFLVIHYLVDVVESLPAEITCERLQDRLLLLRLLEDLIEIKVGSFGGRCEFPSFRLLVDSSLRMIPFLDEVLSVMDICILSPFVLCTEILLSFSFPHQLLNIGRVKILLSQAASATTSWHVTRVVSHTLRELRVRILNPDFLSWLLARWGDEGLINWLLVLRLFMGEKSCFTLE